jgi:hypothetical protein
VNVLLSGALNMVFFRVLYLALFNLFIFYRCFWCDSFLSFHYYTDDLQIYHSFSVADIQKFYDKVNADLNQEPGDTYPQGNC